METSARNQLTGTVTRLSEGKVNTEVEIALNDHDTVTAIVTVESAHRLGLTEGKEATAIIKASQVMVTTEKNPAISARNILCGAIKELRQGAVNCEIDVTLPGGGEIVAIVTEESAEKMGLVPGKEVCAFFKASSVIVAVF